MRQNKNAVFCHGCRKYKMLFETQSKADNFMKFNSDEILEENGKAPVRSYYCEICGGWHVTSNPSAKIGEQLNQRDHQMIQKVISYQKNVEEIKSLAALLNERITEIKSILFFGYIEQAEDLLDICNLDIEEIASIAPHGNAKLTTLRGKVENVTALVNCVKDVLGKSDDERDDCISAITSDKDRQFVEVVVSNIRTINVVEDIVKENDELIANGNIDDIYERINRGREVLDTLRSMGRNRVKAKYNTMFDEQLRQLKKIHVSKQEEEDKKEIEKVDKYINEKEYKTAILSLIDRLDIIQKSYDNGDYDACETAIEIAYYMLDEVGVDDDNTKLIKRQIDQWNERISNTESD